MKQIKTKRPYNLENISNNNRIGQYFFNKKIHQNFINFDKNTPSYIQELKALNNPKKTITKWWNSQSTLSKNLVSKNKHTNLIRKFNEGNPMV
jgi:hypothetical protein